MSCDDFSVSGASKLTATLRDLFLNTIVNYDEAGKLSFKWFKSQSGIDSHFFIICEDSFS